MGAQQISVIPPLLNTITWGGGGGGGFTGKKFRLVYIVAASDQFVGASVKAPLSYVCQTLGSAIF